MSDVAADKPASSSSGSKSGINSSARNSTASMDSISWEEGSEAQERSFFLRSGGSHDAFPPSLPSDAARESGLATQHSWGSSNDGRRVSLAFTHSLDEEDEEEEGRRCAPITESKSENASGGDAKTLAPLESTKSATTTSNSSSSSSSSAWRSTSNSNGSSGNGSDDKNAIIEKLARSPPPQLAPHPPLEFSTRPPSSSIASTASAASPPSLPSPATPLLSSTSNSPLLSSPLQPHNHHHHRPRPPSPSPSILSTLSTMTIAPMEATPGIVLPRNSLPSFSGFLKTVEERASASLHSSAAGSLDSAGNAAHTPSAIVSTVLINFYKDGYGAKLLPTPPKANAGTQDHDANARVRPSSSSSSSSSTSSSPSSSSSLVSVAAAAPPHHSSGAPADASASHNRNGAHPQRHSYLQLQQHNHNHSHSHDRHHAHPSQAHLQHHRYAASEPPPAGQPQPPSLASIPLAAAERETHLLTTAAITTTTANTTAATVTFHHHPTDSTHAPPSTTAFYHKALAMSSATPPSSLASSFQSQSRMLQTQASITSFCLIDSDAELMEGLPVSPRALSYGTPRSSRSESLHSLAESAYRASNPSSNASSASATGCNSLETSMVVSQDSTASSTTTTTTTTTAAQANAPQQLPAEAAPLLADDIPAVLLALTHPETGVQVKDRPWLFFTLNSCFVGKDCLDWFVANLGMCLEDARRYGQKLMDLGFISHKSPGIGLKETNLYAFEADAVDAAVAPLLQRSGRAEQTAHNTLTAAPSTPTPVPPALSSPAPTPAPAPAPASAPSPAKPASLASAVANSPSPAKKKTGIAMFAPKAKDYGMVTEVVWSSTQNKFVPKWEVLSS